MNFAGPDDINEYKKWFLNITKDERPMCYEMIYDRKQTRIIGWQQVNVTLIKPIFDAETGKRLWIMFPGIPNMTRVLYDDQIVYESLKDYQIRTRKEKVKKIINE